VALRRWLELLLWLILLLLPAVLVLAGPKPGTEAGWLDFEGRFLTTQVVPVATGDDRAIEAAGLGELWYAFFGAVGGPGRYLGSALAWLLVSLCLVLILLPATGSLAAAVALLALAASPVVQGLGAARLPWLPAAALVMVTVVFLETLALPTISMRPRSPGRWGPRLIAVLGAGLALALASSADPTVAWVMVLPGFLLFYSLALALHGMYRARGRRIDAVPKPPRSQPMAQLWPLLWRTLPWSLAWFVVLCLLVGLHTSIGITDTDALGAWGEIEPGFHERLWAWLSLPGILVLAWGEIQRSSLGSRLEGSSVVFLSLASFWLFGPALRSSPEPAARLLAAPTFAASLGILLRSPDQGASLWSLIPQRLRGLFGR